MLLQMFNEKECSYKEEISDLKTQQQKGMQIEIEIRKQYNKLEDEFKKLKGEAIYAREELDRFKTSAQASTSK